MQRVELQSNVGSLHCPFCGKRTIGQEGVTPCKHTLFVATDEGLEYCSKKVDGATLITQAAKSNWDKATDGLDYPESIKFAIFVPAPSFLGSYIGYAAHPQ